MKSLNHSYSTSVMTKYESLTINKFEPIHSYKPINPQLLVNPYSKQESGKFPKNPIRKQSSHRSLLSETTQNKHRSSVKNFHYANQSTVMDVANQESKRNKGNKHGKYARWALQTEDIFAPSIVSNRSFEDLGINNNKRALAGQLRDNPDPIIIGKTHKQTRSYLQKIQKQPRRHRDHGNRIKQNLVWQKIKPKTYLQKFRAANRLKTSTKQ